MNDDTLKQIKFLEKNKSFLGREFLTWLWFQIKSSHHTFDFKGLGEFKLYMDDKLILGSKRGNIHQYNLSGGTPAYAKETEGAILSGKLIQEAKFILEQGEREWFFTLMGDTLDLKNIKLPLMKSQEPGHYLADRISMTNFLTDVVRALFEDFLNFRLSETTKEGILSFH